MKTLALCLLLGLSPWATTTALGLGDEPSCHDAAQNAAEPVPAPGAAGEVEQLSVADVTVLDQNGRALHFHRDLVAGKKVMMNFVFTTCSTICPPMGAHFAKIGKLIGEKGGDVTLISVSIDPATDTPERLKAWQENFGAVPGWTLVTGKKQDITRLLKDLRVYSASPEAHGPVVLLADGVSGRWQRVYGLTPPAEILAALEQLAAPRVAAKETGR